MIDLEDRWFDRRWQELGKENLKIPEENATDGRWATKPLEARTLTPPPSSEYRGTVICWVDILSPAEANEFPPDDVSLPPSQLFEVRIVIWKARNVPAMDMGGMSDLFCKVMSDCFLGLFFGIIFLNGLFYIVDSILAFCYSFFPFVSLSSFSISLPLLYPLLYARLKAVT